MVLNGIGVSGLIAVPGAILLAGVPGYGLVGGTSRRATMVYDSVWLVAAAAIPCRRFAAVRVGRGCGGCRPGRGVWRGWEV